MKTRMAAMALPAQKSAELAQDVTLPIQSGHDQGRLEDVAAASEERQATELAIAVSTDWHADG
jgi:hypothetical protein